MAGVLARLPQEGSMWGGIGMTTVNAHMIRAVAGRKIFCGGSSPENVARDAHIVELVDGGMSYSRAGKVMGISKNTVAGALHRARYPDYLTAERERAKEWRRRLSADETFNRKFRKQELVRSIMATKNVAPRYVPFLELYAQGLTMTEIGIAKNLTRQRVQQILKMYGIGERSL
jgi:hypothetical protein